MEEHIEQAVVGMAIDNPALGQVRVSNELRKKGILISPGGVRSIWLRHDMETFQKRLKALSAKVEQEGIILDENQVAALEKAKEEKQAHGEIETYYPGFLVAQDTYYVGYIKGGGHIYQQTVIDTYSKIGFAKLYDRKNALVAADMLNDRVVPFFEQHDLKKIYTSIEQMQTDLDAWMNLYNTERTHSGKYCFGKTPMQTFIEGIAVARKYQLQNQEIIKPNDVNKTPSGCESEESCLTSQQIADSFWSR